MSTQIEISRKLSSIENEINTLKAMVLKLSQGKKHNSILQLEGALKGVSVSEKDIESAKKSLFKVGA